MSIRPSHYQNGSIEPIDFIISNNLGFCEGNVIKYVSRWKYKNGIEDLKKAMTYLEFLIDSVEHESNLPTFTPQLLTEEDEDNSIQQREY
jgi:hypothetical protein